MKKEKEPDIKELFEMFQQMQEICSTLEERVRCIEDTVILWPTKKNIEAVKWLNSLNGSETNEKNDPR